MKRGTRIRRQLSSFNGDDNEIAGRTPPPRSPGLLVVGAVAAGTAAAVVVSTASLLLLVVMVLPGPFAGLPQTHAWVPVLAPIAPPPASPDLLSDGERTLRQQQRQRGSRRGRRRRHRIATTTVLLRATDKDETEPDEGDKEGGGGFLGRFFSGDDGADDQKKEKDVKATEKEDDGGGFLAWIRRSDSGGEDSEKSGKDIVDDVKKLQKELARKKEEEERRRRARQAEAEKARKKAERERDARTKKEEQKRKNQIELLKKKKEDQQREREKLEKQKEKQRQQEMAKMERERQKEDKKRERGTKEEVDGSGGLLSGVQSFLTNNTLFNSTKASNETASAVDDRVKGGGGNPFSMVQKFLTERTSKPVEQWVTVFRKTRIMPGQMVPVSVMGLDLLVIASRDGRRLYCIANSCPHLGTPLEMGQLVRLPVDDKTPGKGKKETPPSSSAAPQSPIITEAFDRLTERDVSNLLSQDGCEDCVVCPLHRTAFALESGDVRGEWCPYPPILGKVTGMVKQPTGAAVFDVRTRGKFVEVRINTPLKSPPGAEDQK